MFCLYEPGRADIDQFISSTREDNFTYPFVGATRDVDVLRSNTSDMHSYNIDHNRTRIGAGKNDWQRAKAAVRTWKMFDFRWVELCGPYAPIEAGQNVAILVRHLRFYSLNAARIVYTFDEPNRDGFAYGTLVDHGESGEERFLVEFDSETGEVWYDLYVISRPNHFLAWLGYPFTRTLQKQFATDSKAAMLRAATSGNDLKL